METQSIKIFISFEVGVRKNNFDTTEMLQTNLVIFFSIYFGVKQKSELLIFHWESISNLSSVCKRMNPNLNI